MSINISDYSQEELKSIVRWEKLSLLEKDENDDIFLELLNEKNRSKIEEVLQMQITATETYERLEKIRKLNQERMFGQIKMKSKKLFQIYFQNTKIQHWLFLIETTVFRQQMNSSACWKI